MEHIITIDYETRSMVDLRLKGRKNYMDDPSFKILLMSVKKDNEETIVYEFPTKELIQNIIDMAVMLDYKILAQNASFEIEASEAYGAETYTRDKSSIWRDSMISCAYHSVPASLEEAGKYLSLKTTKLTIGKSLIDLFTKPIPARIRESSPLFADKMFYEPKDFPKEWEQFKIYNKFDVDSTYELYNALPSVPLKVWDEWLLNLNINRHGILIDKTLCLAAIKDLESEEVEATEKLKNLTGLLNPKSRDQIKAWFKDSYKIDITSLDKTFIDYSLSSPNLDDYGKKVLRLFGSISKTSTTKYMAFLNLMDQNNKVYDILHFYGARTGRWSSWGVQIHNMKRIELPNYKDLREQAKEGWLPMFYDNVADIYSHLIRTAIIAPKGKILVIADFSQIEARVLQWLCNNEEALNIFNSGKDYYTYTASMMFNKPYEEIPHDSEMRRQGKTATLALGYGGAVGALNRFQGGKDLGEEEKLKLITLWRKANQKVVNFWKILEAAFIKCFITEKEIKVPIAKEYELTFSFKVLNNKKVVAILLPSGREIWFNDVCVRGKSYVFYGKASEDSFTDSYVEVYGGFLAENITQAIARDCLQNFVTRLTNMGLEVIFHVHDEVIIEVDEQEVVQNNLLDKVLETSKLNTGYTGLPIVAEPKASYYYDK